MFNYAQVPKTKEYRDNFDRVFAKGAKEVPKTEKTDKDNKAKEERGKK